MNYRKKYEPAIGYTKLSEIGSSTLQMLEFGMIELKEGDTVSLETGEKEYAFIFLFGHADVKTSSCFFENVGGRTSVFGGKAHSVYVPCGDTVEFLGKEHVKIAVVDTPCSLPGKAEHITPDRVRATVLGVKPWERDTHFIIDDQTNARFLTIGEAFITPGNWAGFPPHKHDVEDMPHEGVLEEIYYFLFQPEQGFAIQCLYTGDGEIDEAYRVKQDEFVEFPKGYHTTVGAPGYNTYFLWMMAGKHQGFFRSNDPDHDWVTAVENVVKKNR